jgi:hypothetical protein
LVRANVAALEVDLDSRVHEPTSRAQKDCHRDHETRHELDDVASQTGVAAHTSSKIA